MSNGAQGHDEGTQGAQAPLRLKFTLDQTNFRKCETFFSPFYNFLSFLRKDSYGNFLIMPLSPSQINTLFT